MTSVIMVLVLVIVAMFASMSIGMTLARKLKWNTTWSLCDYEGYTMVWLCGPLWLCGYVLWLYVLLFW